MHYLLISRDQYNSEIPQIVAWRGRIGKPNFRLCKVLVFTNLFLAAVCCDLECAESLFFKHTLTVIK